jgi:hypothetical protein
MPRYGQGQYVLEGNRVLFHQTRSISSPSCHNWVSANTSRTENCAHVDICHLQCAGVAGIAAALIHGVLGETKVFAKATIQPESLRTLIRLVWQAGTVAWIGGGVLLIAAPSLGSESARHWIVVTIVSVYAFAAAANAWWSRGRGFGWKALGAVVVLAVAGY